MDNSRREVPTREVVAYIRVLEGNAALLPSKSARPPPGIGRKKQCAEGGEAAHNADLPHLPF